MSDGYHIYEDHNVEIASIPKKRGISLLWPILACFLALFLLRDCFLMNIPSGIFLALSVIIALFANKTELIAFCFCCIPMLNAFQSKYALLICMVLYVLRFEKRHKVSVYIWPILCLMIWEIAHGVFAPFSLLDLMRLFAELFFCCFLMCCHMDEWDFCKIIRAMATTTVCVCFIILFAQLNNSHLSNINDLFLGVFRFGYGVDESRMSVGFNPNYLAYICLACIEGLSMIVYQKKHTIIDIVLIVLLSVFGLLTMSKKFVLCAVILVFLLAVASEKTKARLKILAVSGIMLLIFALILYRYFPSIYDSLIDRFKESDITTGRDSIFLFYMNAISSDVKLFLFGVGLQDYEAKLVSTYPGASIPHNGFQELVVMWGIFGLIVFSIFLFNLLRQAKRVNRKMRLINYIPFIVMLANVQVTQMVSSSVTNMVLALVYYLMTINCTDCGLREQKMMGDRVQYAGE